MSVAPRRSTFEPHEGWCGCGCDAALRWETFCPWGEGESGDRWLTHKALFIPPVSQIQGLELNDCCFCLSVSTDKLGCQKHWRHGQVRFARETMVYWTFWGFPFVEDVGLLSKSNRETAEHKRESPTLSRRYVFTSLRLCPDLIFCPNQSSQILPKDVSEQMDISPPLTNTTVSSAYKIKWVFMTVGWAKTWALRSQGNKTGLCAVSAVFHVLHHLTDCLLLCSGFQDVHVMIFIGFGFLMTFLQKYGFGSVGFNFLIAAFSLQWATLMQGFFHGMHEGKIHVGVERCVSKC